MKPFIFIDVHRTSYIEKKIIFLNFVSYIIEVLDFDVLDIHLIEKAIKFEDFKYYI